MSSLSQYPLIEVSGRAFTTHRTEYLNDTIKYAATPLYKFPSAPATR